MRKFTFHALLILVMLCFWPGWAPAGNVAASDIPGVDIGMTQIMPIMTLGIQAEMNYGLYALDYENSVPINMEPLAYFDNYRQDGIGPNYFDIEPGNTDMGTWPIRDIALAINFPLRE